MKRVLLAAAFVALCGVGGLASLHGQGLAFPGCPKCGVFGYVDMPSSSRTVSRADLLQHRAAFEGWGFECVSGRPVDRVELWYETVDDGPWKPLKQSDFSLWSSYWSRPDVQAAYLASCPSMYGVTTGWVLWIDNPPPLGARRFQVDMWRGPYVTTQRLTLNIVP